MFFSKRTPGDLTNNPIAEALERPENKPYLDLTATNPTTCGFDYSHYPFELLNDPKVMDYDPQPFGLLEARGALAEHLLIKGLRVNPANILLVSSTSEAYSYLFKMLADPGQNFLVPTPGYPLLEHLLTLESLEAVPYSLTAGSGWNPDPVECGQKITPESKGFISISPHNPTGAVLKSPFRESILESCRRHDLAFIQDEVFSDYLLGEPTPVWIPPADVLSFRLGGLSKSLGLPQLKLSWVLMDGPEKVLAECRERLEVIADTYLSLNTPVQRALQGLLKAAPEFQKQVMERIERNRRVLGRELASLGKLARLWPSEGGWSALVELLQPDPSAAEGVLDLLRQKKVFVQPGEFYDFQQGNFWVLSLLTPPALFDEGVRRMAAFLIEKHRF
jgi:aspartate/methionine/tyrosine aminotransferase